MIDIDGSLGEGGGQILRSSLALALLTGQAFHLRHVRAGRPKPGLQPQHLMSVRAAAAIGQAQTRGASLGSGDLSFEPGTVVAGNYHFPIGTAGATGLVLHTIYLPLALRGDAPSAIVLQGGTHVIASPTFPFLDATWRSYMERLGLELKLRLIRPGFYPRGGGVVEAQVQPCQRLKGLRLMQRGVLKSIMGVSAVAGLPEAIAGRQARRATQRLRALRLDVNIREESWPGGPGTVLAVQLDTTPTPTVFVALGARGKSAERVADDIVDEVTAFVEGNGAVDPHSADQLVLPLALAEGPSEFSVTQVTRHLTTNVTVIRRFLERGITVEGAEGAPGIVRIDAI